MRFAVGLISIVMLIVALLGCTPSSRPIGVVQPVGTTTQVNLESPVVAPSTGLTSLGNVGDGTSIMSNDTNDAERLTKLWYKRTREAALADYPLGPGDVLEISVPNLDEIQTFSARITGDGTITLPLVGMIQAANSTEAQLRDEIRRCLEAKYMNDPQVNVFVREYRSRQVAASSSRV